MLVLGPSIPSIPITYNPAEAAPFDASLLLSALQNLRSARKTEK